MNKHAQKSCSSIFMEDGQLSAHSENVARQATNSFVGFAMLYLSEGKTSSEETSWQAQQHIIHRRKKT